MDWGFSPIGNSDIAECYGCICSNLDRIAGGSYQHITILRDVVFSQL
ncbi:hypothetical protein [Xylanibacter brevis]|nr:hypothetical protein [Xylanibacter brevis]